ncbi:MAG: hypothetical protein IPJ48_17940 [Propionivibrio sp.]|uniref:Uncharacterized protein n=1 Tax=Candidatus Propionivibrio dominans TaxID=2954373 RepID=A0A9D7FA03_9RHOO|nr:hypothetical protein [Candidatus Propionivibrio dominans]
MVAIPPVDQVFAVNQVGLQIEFGALVGERAAGQVEVAAGLDAAVFVDQIRRVQAGLATDPNTCRRRVAGDNILVARCLVGDIRDVRATRWIVTALAVRRLRVEKVTPDSESAAFVVQGADIDRQIAKSFNAGTDIVE